MTTKKTVKHKPKSSNKKIPFKVDARAGEILDAALAIAEAIEGLTEAVETYADLQNAHMKAAFSAVEKMMKELDLMKRPSRIGN